MCISYVKCIHNASSARLKLKLNEALKQMNFTAIVYYMSKVFFFFVNVVCYDICTYLYLRNIIVDRKITERLFGVSTVAEYLPQVPANTLLFAGISGLLLGLK